MPSDAATPTLLPWAVGTVLTPAGLGLGVLFWSIRRAARRGVLSGPDARPLPELLPPELDTAGAAGTALFAVVGAFFAYAFLATAVLEALAAVAPDLVPPRPPPVPNPTAPPPPPPPPTAEQVTVHSAVESFGRLAGGVGMCLLLAIRLSPAGPAALGLTAVGLRRSLLAGIVGFLAVWPICLLSVWLAAMLLPPREHQVIEQLMRFTEDGRTGVVVMLIVAAVPVAAISEEVFFRGLMQSSLRDVFSRLAARSTDAGKPDPSLPWDPTTPGPSALTPGLPAPRNLGPGPRWAAVLVTSLLFAGAHVPYWHAMPALFALSVCMGLLLERTGSLAAPFVVHLLFNVLNVAVSFGRA